jgi:site-specific DNA recombinase
VKAIIYAAKSTEDRHKSIPTQLEDCRELAETEGWEVAGEFSDEGFSAYSGNRGPNLERAKQAAAEAAAKSGEPCALVAQHSDRFARGAGDAPGAADSLTEIWHAMRRQNVHLRSVQNDYDMSDPVLLAVASKRDHEDSKRKSAATRAGMKRRAARGLYTGRRPYGYRFGGGVLELVAHEAEIVRRIFAEFIAGRSFVAIARGLHADAIPTTSGRATWRSSTVSGIVRNALYAGQLAYDGEIADGEHEAIIDADTWQRAADLLASRGPSKGRGRPPKGSHLFRGGQLRCGRCGDAMVPRTKLQPSQQYYCCSGHIQLGNDYCPQGCVRRSVIDSAVFEYFAALGLDVEATRRQVAEAHDRKLAEAEALAERAEREVPRLEEEHKRGTREFREGGLAGARYEVVIADIESELSAAAAEAKRLRAAADAVGEPLGDAESEVLRSLAAIRSAVAGEVKGAEGAEAIRAALSRLFSGFWLHPQKGANYGDRTGRAELVDIDADYMIEIEVREQALEGYTESGMYPVLRREPLGQAPNNQGLGSGCLK